MKLTLEIVTEQRDYQQFRPVVGTGFTTPEGARVNTIHFDGSTVVQMEDGTQYVFSMVEMLKAAIAHYEEIEKGEATP